MIPDNELREMRERCEAATPGPWRNSKGSSVWANPNPNAASLFVAEFSCVKADSQFAAHSRTDLPRLLDEVGRLRTELSAARSVIVAERSPEWADQAIAHEMASSRADTYEGCLRRILASIDDGTAPLHGTWWNNGTETMRDFVARVLASGE